MLDRLLDALSRALVWIGGLLMLSVMVITVVDIISRWTVQTGYIGLVDITQFAVVGFVYLSLPHLFLTDGNVAIALYDKKMSKRQDAALQLLTQSLSLGILSVLFNYCLQRAERVLRYGDVSQNIEIPMIGFWLLILVGLALTLLVVFVGVIKAIAGLFGKMSDAD